MNERLVGDQPLIALIEQLLSQGREVRFRASGHSMGPAIRDGSRIAIRPAVPSELQVGDVALYRAGDRLIAHRIVRILQAPSGRSSEPQPLQFIMSGETAGSAEDVVDGSQILGKVSSVEGRGGAKVPASPGRIQRLAYSVIRTLEGAAAAVRGQSRDRRER